MTDRRTLTELPDPQRKGAFEPIYDEATAHFACGECGAGEAALIQHPDDETTLVCVVCGTRFDTPDKGPWTFTVAA